MKLEMRVDGSTVSKVHGVRRLNTQVNPNELQTETWGENAEAQLSSTSLIKQQKPFSLTQTAS